MSNYVKTTNFTLKDSLPTGDPNKVVRGSEFDTEFNALQVASATKADLLSPTFTGTATFDNVTVTGTADLSGASVSIDINGGTIDNTVIGGTTPAAGTFTSLVSATADINGGTIDGAVIGGSTPAAGTFAAIAGTTGTFSGAVSGTTGTFSGAVSGTTGTFSGAVTGSNLNIANWDTAFGWGNHATAGYLTSVAFSDIDAGAITTSSETFTTSDTQLPTNAAVRSFMINTYPTIVEINDLSAAVVWTTVPDAYISASSVNQHVTLEKATQTKTYANNETSTIALSAAITSGAPVVSVTKEVPQTGLTDNTWDVASDGANYDFENSAYSTTLTPSNASADGVFTLGSGSFAATDLGKIVSGNGGTAVIIKTDGSYNLLTNFTNTSTIASGSWTLKKLVVDGDATGIALSSGTDEEGGSVYDLRNTVYTGSDYSLTGSTGYPSSGSFNTDGTKLFIADVDNNGIRQYTLSTAFNPTTISGSSSFFSTSSQEPYPRTVIFNSDGTKMYAVGNNSTVYQYALSTAFDVTSASYSGTNFGFGLGTIQCIRFNPAGTKFFVGYSSGLKEYTLSTAFDLSSKSYDRELSNSVYENGTITDLNFNSDGTQLYILKAVDLFKFNLGTAYSLINTTSFLSKIDVSALENDPQGLLFNTNLSNLYLWGSTNDKIFEYSLDPRFNLKSADYMGNSFNVNSQETYPQGVAFNNDGTKMYVVGRTADSVFQYSLSTAFDLSTASYDSVSFSVASEDTQPNALAFNTTGTKMYIIGTANNTVHQYSLSTAFDLSTASYDSVSFSVNSQETYPQGVAFNNDGTKMYVVGTTNSSVFQYSLSTAFDLSTASYNSVSFSVSSQDTQPYALAFNTTGTKMYIAGDTNNSVYQYTLSTAFDLSTASYDSVSFSVTSQDSAPTGLAFNTAGSKMYVLGSANDTIYEYEMGGGFSLKAVEYSGDSFSVASQELLPTDMAFNNDGTKMYIVGQDFDSVFQYTLSTAFDVSTASYASLSVSVASQTGAPRALCFNNDGTKMYVGGQGTAFQYTLSTAFNVSTASYASKSFSFSSQDGAVQGVSFNTDGTKMYMVASSTDTVYQYSLSTAFDVSTASYASKSFSVASQEANPGGLTFNTTGNKMYIIGETPAVYQYSLSTAFDVSTASYFSVSFNVKSQENNIATGVVFNTDGSKMFVIGQSSDKVHEYNVGSTLIQVPVVYSSDYAVAVTNSGGQINTTYWADINSTTATEAVGTGEVYYAYSTDNHVTWKVIHNTNGQRSIARNNSGTWQYNSNATYGSETWANATTNTEFAALRQAFSVAANRMDGTQMDAVADANHLTLANSLDFMIALKNADSTSTSPTSDGVALNYDGNVLNQGAVLGTDYNWDFPSSTSVRLTSLGAYNLKVRII